MSDRHLSADAAAELRLLRTEIAAMRGHMAAGRMRHGWLKHVIKGLETDPDVQYRVHFWGAVYWLVNMPAVLAVALFASGLWLKISVVLLVEYSLYANLATDYGAMSAAMAARGSSPLPEIPAEPARES